jgi:Mrp family chromosome partitioning ATPase
MERIKEAVEIAKANRQRRPDPVPVLQDPRNPAAPMQPRPPVVSSYGTVVKLDANHLSENRIIGFDPTNPMARGFEMLRTQVSTKMRDAGFQTIGITSPTPGCGKTVCAVNLAFSMSRLVERSVTLVDADFRKPQIANYLGFKGTNGLESYLAGKIGFEDVALLPESGKSRFKVFPTYRASRDAAEQISSTRMADLVATLRQEDPTGIVIFDLPPVMVVDDVMSFLPHLDCVLLVVASGQTTVSDIVTAERLLGSAHILGTVLNKAEAESQANYYYN